jgi:hypothetical protein
LRGDELVEFYDHLLVDDEVYDLVSTLRGWLAYRGVRTIIFYTKNKPAWSPYIKAIKTAAKDSKVELEVRLLPDDA